MCVIRDNISMKYITNRNVNVFTLCIRYASIVLLAECLNVGTETDKIYIISFKTTF